MGRLSFFNYSAHIVVTLFNPERVEQLERSQKSQIVCLQDISSSMETKDIILDESGPIQRIEWTQQFLQKD